MVKTQEQLNPVKCPIELNDDELDNVVGGQSVESTIENLNTLTGKINTSSNTNTDANRQSNQGEMNPVICQINPDTLSTFDGKILSDGSHNSESKIG